MAMRMWVLLSILKLEALRVSSALLCTCSGRLPDAQPLLPNWRAGLLRRYVLEPLSALFYAINRCLRSLGQPSCILSDFPA
jgi:hypothetical protein